MRGLGTLVVAALLSAAGVAAAVGNPPAPPRPAAQVTTQAAAPQPVLPQVPAGYDAPATLTPAPDTTTPAAPAAFVPVATVDADVPARALEAYQRAAAVIDQADTSCHLAWPLLAAIGRVESDHGQTAGSQLAADGKAQPPILGPPLDGVLGTARVVDTDHGSLDGDTGVDRALGPMQFIPATWAAVAVDADGDGVRDPQDIDDAALGAAVFLCASHDDLATDAGQRAALLRYNHSQAYVQVVLETMTQYASAYGASATALLLAAVAPTTLPGIGSGLVVEAAPVPGAISDPADSTWSDVDQPSWVGAPPPAAPTPSAPPASSPTPAVPPTTDPSAPPTASPSTTPSATPSPTPSPSPSVTPSATPTPEATPSPTASAAPSPSSVPSPATSPTSTPTSAPSSDVPFHPTTPAPTG
ncbi:MAG TPA: lytic murein transglycosylase, partial [Nocardioides sp.]|nr:lytic murein transglycosylase [Nocardioides sp.]